MSNLNVNLNNIIDTVGTKKTDKTMDGDIVLLSSLLPFSVGQDLLS